MLIIKNVAGDDYSCTGWPKVDAPKLNNRNINAKSF